jgi:hypothetical protein
MINPINEIIMGSSDIALFIDKQLYGRRFCSASITYDICLFSKRYYDPVANLMQSYTLHSFSKHYRKLLFTIDITKIQRKYSDIFYGIASNESYFIAGDSNVLHQWCGGNLIGKRFGMNCVYELEDRTKLLPIFINRFMKAEFQALWEEQKEYGVGYSLFNEEEIIKIAREGDSGELFSALFDCGDISRHANEDGADLALSNIIGSKPGVSYDMLDRIYRKSNLYNDDPSRWDNLAYRDRTIRNSLGRYYQFQSV